MPKRVIIVHGWNGSPERDWIPWLRKELVDRKIRVEVLPMPEADRPSMPLWISFLQESSGHIDADTYFVGHSIGCQAIVRMIQKLPPAVRVGGIVLIAPFVRLKPAAFEDEEDSAIAKPWLDEPMYWEEIRGKVQKSVVLLSDNDPVVYVEDAKIFHAELHADVRIIHNRGHFSQDENVLELPEGLEAMLEMMEK